MSVQFRSLPEADPRIQNSRVRVSQGVITGTRKLTYDTMELVVQCDPASAPLSGTAGQYAILATPSLSKPRAYSFAMAPENEEAGRHTFFVKLIHGGEFSGWLFRADRTGEPITLTGPLGQFVLDSSADPMVCIAGGSGMSAIKAILEHAANRSVKRDALFLYGARTQADLYCQDEIESIKRKWNADYRFDCVNVLSMEPKDSGWAGARGLVTEYFESAYLRGGKSGIGNSRAYLCGPPPMVDAAVSVLVDGGMAPGRIHYDKFEDASSPAPVIDNSKCVLCDECLLVKPIQNCIVEASGFVLDKNDGVEGYLRVNPARTSGLYYNSLYIDEDECIRCLACVHQCPTNAISPSNSVNPAMLRNMRTGAPPA